MSTDHLRACAVQIRNVLENPNIKPDELVSRLMAIVRGAFADPRFGGPEWLGVLDVLATNATPIPAFRKATRVLEGEHDAFHECNGVAEAQNS